MLDPIADMLTRIRNAQEAGHHDVLISASKIKLGIANVLKQECFVGDVCVEKADPNDLIRIELKYHKVSNTRKIPGIKEIRRISSQGQRVYVKNKDIRSVRNRFGIAIISTSKGLMTDRDTKTNGLGGEYLCEVW